MPLPKIVRVEAKSDYRLELVFDDGLQGVISVKDLLTGPVFEPLKDTELFAQVRVEEHFGGIFWPTGADLCPGSLHAEVLASREDIAIEMSSGCVFADLGVERPACLPPASKARIGRYRGMLSGQTMATDDIMDMTRGDEDDRQEYVRKLIAGVRKQCRIDPETIEASEEIGRQAIPARWIEAMILCDIVERELLRRPEGGQE